MKRKNIYFNHIQCIRFYHLISPNNQIFHLKITLTILIFFDNIIFYLFIYLSIHLFNWFVYFIYLFIYSLFISIAAEHKTPYFSFFV